MNKKVVVEGLQIIGTVPVPELCESEEDADRCLGREAGLAGKPNDTTKSQDWQRGWAEAQK